MERGMVGKTMGEWQKILVEDRSLQGHIQFFGGQRLVGAPVEIGGDFGGIFAGHHSAENEVYLHNPDSEELTKFAYDSDLIRSAKLPQIAVHSLLPDGKVVIRCRRKDLPPLPDDI